MIVCIPSYKRAGRVTTVDFLGDAFSKDEIIIGTQTKEDYEAYLSIYGDRATVIYKDGDCCSDNRNSLLEWCQQHGHTSCFQLDDDVRYIRAYNRQKMKGSEARELMQQCENLSKQNDITLLGAYCCDNPLMMSRTCCKNILVGMFLYINDTSVRFDKKFLIKHDFELSLRLMREGRKVIRLNSFAPVAAHESKGGCEDAWKRKDYIVEAEWLAEAFPEYCELSKKNKGEIKFKKK